MNVSSVDSPEPELANAIRALYLIQKANYGIGENSLLRSSTSTLISLSGIFGLSQL
jgi:hypothetical protein